MDETIQLIVGRDDANQVDSKTLSLALAILALHAPEEAHLEKLTSSQCVILLKEKPQLEETLRKAIRDHSYEDVISLLPTVRSVGSGPLHRPRGIPSKDDVNAFFCAFQIPYESDFHVALLRVIDKYHADRAYSHSMSINQSSGTGKSRGVEQMAQSRFTFLFNLRPKFQGYSYPPPDANVRDYFTHRSKTTDDIEVQKRYYAFLCSLFTHTKSLLSSSDRQGVSLPQWWYNHLNANASPEGPDQRRVAFYGEVIEHAEAFLKERSNDDISKELHRSCQDFVEYLTGQYKLDGPSGQQTPRVACILAFDESQALVEVPDDKRRRSHFRNLESVLAQINSYEVFSIFLSTNTDLRLFAPPAYLHPSIRVRAPGPPHPPITELPFDVFANGLYTELVKDGKSALNDTCSVEVMARFGRTLWHSLCSSDYLSVIELAMDKLTPNRRMIEDDENAQLACLGIRIGLDFDASRETGRKKDLELVESYMRVVFAVPKHGEFIRSGTPSEPILAEAAARLLNTLNIETLAPEALCKALKNGLIVRGEREEMVGRLLWTLAHDKVLRGRDNGEEVRYHKPVLLIDFLEGLFHPDHWETIRNAMPVGDPDGPPLSVAFKDAYIHFSHFVDGADYEIIHIKQVYKLLLRGAALSCGRNQRSIDFLTPILVGSPDSTAICESESSVLQGRIKNRNEPDEVQVPPALVCPESWRHPVISLVHELGSEERGVKITQEDHRSAESGDNPNGQHYQIVAYGCSSATYGVIPKEMDDKYSMLLGSSMLMENFPRSEMTECASLMKWMNPGYGLEQGADECWWFGKDM